ncbi:hypothetical protein [Streptomyces olivaceus]|uniref:hypothetical protein n=1 Tax=Streptomyces olivaceus TaxID=47716 RepID=UPI0036EB0E92
MKLRNLFRKSVPTVSTPTLVVQHDDLKNALAGLASIFGDPMTVDHIGESFSCGEADQIARVLVLAGHREAAETLLSAHARGDELEDFHFTRNDEDPEDEGRPLNDKEVSQYVDDLELAPSVAELVGLIGL